MTMHEGLIDQSDKFKKRVASADLSQYKVIQRGQLVVGFPIDEGVLDFQSRYAEAIVSPAYGVWDLSDETRTDRNYLARFLRSPIALAYYRSKLRGSTARRRSLPSATFLELPIPHPPLDEQRRIAAILDQADALRAKRRQTLAHLDDLTQSIFLDMFGDPEDAIYAGRTVPLDEVVSDFQGGKNLVALDSIMSTRNRVLKISAVTQSHFRPNESKPVPDDYEPPANHYVHAGDLLISRANTTELVGATAFVAEAPPNLLLPDKLWRLVWRHPQETEPLYVWALFQTAAIRRQLSARSSGTGGSMKNISKAKMRTLPVPWPERTVQQAFVRRLRQAQSCRRRAAAADLDDLFASLQSRAFSGQL